MNPDVGLFNKYIVTQADNSPIDFNTEFFVLRLDENQNDKEWLFAARNAMHIFADIIAASRPQLASDIRTKWPLTQELYHEVFGTPDLDNNNIEA